ncbi:STAS/SEC14 domain-containing protein [Aliamphritea hakodatensis]|uniref:STAS/SEC14 domain-containing protein n=1 Tax=Aliamphritea hakodatensis TaxID=2895352 RepID=UPI0022FD5E07|nr:STAS/SEC14 domain-containing protein [Aliamphritea hakodatensis]
MLEMIDIGIDNAVAFRISGKITEQDMTRVLDASKEKVEHYGSIVILEKIESFHGVELAALLEEFRYLREVGMSNMRKVAIQTDKTWIEHIVRIEDKLFSGIDMQCFAMDDDTAAIEFLKA